ncbi:MAG: tRNA pseudouridine(55) synthase TruB [Nitriliruptoraceae bacterium]
MSRRRSADDLEGVVVIDKPAGMTSHDVVQRVRRALGQSRVGHTGTLDPAATGVMVVCLGRATRLVQFLQAGTKTYAARMVLGIETDSQDADGEIIARMAADHIDERQLCEALTKFQGQIAQIPPMVSAVKVGGERLHRKARRGEVVDREPRHVTVHDLVLDMFEPGEHPRASFLVTCSSGTYVRTLAHDVGHDLGVGGSLESLRRLANEPFHLDEAVSLEDFEEAAQAGRMSEFIMSAYDAAIRALPVWDVEDAGLVMQLVSGARLDMERRMPPAAVVGADAFAVTWSNLLVGVYKPMGQEGIARQARAALVWSQPDDVGGIQVDTPTSATPTDRGAGA